MITVCWLTSGGVAAVATSPSIRLETALPAFARTGVIVSPMAVTVCQNAAVDGWISCACAAVASTISVVSDGLPISKPVSAAMPRRALAMRSSRYVTIVFTATTPATASSRSDQFLTISLRSRLMPTLIRKTPNANPLNGAVITSTSVWYSVSAISSPARRAPTIGDRPAAVVATLATITTSNEAARKSSGLLVRAAWANRRGRITRPAR